MNLNFIANITLNISLCIYSLMFLPQILHNKNNNNLKNISLYWHTLMYLSFSLDFFYGISMKFAWQYCLVSTMGLTFIMAQQWQLYKLYKKTIYLCILITHFIFLAIYFLYCHAVINYELAQLFSIIARSAGLLAMLPQIIYNHKNNTARGINIRYLQLNLCLVWLDSASAWILNWGWANKIATPTTGLLYITLWMQHKSHCKQQSIKVFLRNYFMSIKSAFGSKVSPPSILND